VVYVPRFYRGTLSTDADYCEPAQV
jgi:hypothetical protein